MEKKTDSSSLMHDLRGNTSSTFSTKVIAILFLIALLGIGTGYLLAHNVKKGEAGGVVGNLLNKASIPAGKTFGSDDTETYKDVAEGTLKEGGIEGEGQYHLERAGGASQNVYMTSSLVDLSQFIDRKIKVWGQTQAAQKAGWLMDVGRVEVLQ